jgi:hypothetical protein
LATVVVTCLTAKSVSQQCELLNLNRSTFYYTEKVNNKKHEIQQEIVKVFAKTPIYGAKKVHQQLLENGVKRLFTFSV